MKNLFAQQWFLFIIFLPGFEPFLKFRRRGKRIGKRKLVPKQQQPSGLENRDVIVDFGLVFLGDALCDPDDVSVLLLLEFDEAVEGAVVEVVQE